MEPGTSLKLIKQNSRGWQPLNGCSSPQTSVMLYRNTDHMLVPSPVHACGTEHLSGNKQIVPLQRKWPWLAPFEDLSFASDVLLLLCSQKAQAHDDLKSRTRPVLKAINMPEQTQCSPSFKAISL